MSPQDKKDTEPWTVTTCEKTRVREILRDFKVLDVDIAWSWVQFKWLYRLTIKA